MFVAKSQRAIELVDAAPQSLLPALCLNNTQCEQAQTSADDDDDAAGEVVAEEVVAEEVVAEEVVAGPTEAADIATKIQVGKHWADPGFCLK